MLSVEKPGSTVVDLFAGTGVVSRALAYTNRVISGDIQKYSGTLTEVLCAPATFSEDNRSRIARAAQAWLSRVAPLAADLLAYEEQASSRSVTNPIAFALLVEEGSLLQAGARDPVLAAAKSASTWGLRAAGATLTTHYGGAYFSYLHALQLDTVMAAIGQGTAEEPTQNHRHRSRRTYAIYADPSYTRDHYSRSHHILETIALGDLPGISNTPGSKTSQVEACIDATVTNRHSASERKLLKRSTRSFYSREKSARPSCSHTRRKAAALG